MATVAKLIVRVLDAPADEASLARVRGEVRELCEQFPMYADLLAAEKGAKPAKRRAKIAPAKRPGAAKRAPAKRKAPAKQGARKATRPARRAKR